MLRACRRSPCVGQEVARVHPRTSAAVNTVHPLPQQPINMLLRVTDEVIAKYLRHFPPYSCYDQVYEVPQRLQDNIYLRRQQQYEARHLGGGCAAVSSEGRGCSLSLVRACGYVSATVVGIRCEQGVVICTSRADHDLDNLYPNVPL